MNFNLCEPRMETVIQFTEWVCKRSGDYDAKTVIDTERGVIRNSDTTIGLLLAPTKRGVISEIFEESLTHESINPEKMKWGSIYLSVNGVCYQTKLVTGILTSLNVNFGEFPIYQGAKGKHPLLFITNKFNEVGVVAPLLDVIKEGAA